MNHIKYEEGYKYQLYETVVVKTSITGHKVDHAFFELDEDGRLTIFKGYAWDGASGAIDTKTIMRGSLVHDVLFQMMRAGLLPLSCFHPANEELRKICLEDGMWSIRANYVFDAVEELGERFSKPQPEKILIAPKL